MSEVNIPLLRKAVEWVEQQDSLPEEKREWMQSTYVARESYRVNILRHKTGCGTAYCVAGYIGAMVDPRFDIVDWAEQTDGSQVHVSDVAQKSLGLTDSQAGQLFYYGNGSRQIRTLAEKFAGEKL